MNDLKLILIVFLILTHNLYLETEWERETEWGNKESPINRTFEKYVWAYSTNLIILVFLILISNLFLETESEWETEWV